MMAFPAVGAEEVVSNMGIWIDTEPAFESGQSHCHIVQAFNWIVRVFERGDGGMLCDKAVLRLNMSGGPKCSVGEYMNIGISNGRMFIESRW